MSQPTASNPNRRVLIIDDTQSIHDDYAKILRPNRPSAEETGLDGLDELDKLIFEDEGAAGSNNAFIDFDVSHALQGQEGVALVSRALQEEEPIALAFVDMRMPPGIDGMETIQRIWKMDERVQIVICSAYSDHPWQDIVTRLGRSERLLILKKPFDQAEVYQMAAALTEKWSAERNSQLLTQHLESQVKSRTASLNEANQKLTKLNEDLEIALDEAQCAARAKGRFLATISHEIRTTANAFSEVRDECLSAGMNDFLAKPIRMAELRSTLANWLAPAER